MIIINESPYMSILLKKNIFIEDNIKIISTKGFLNDYQIINNKIKKIPLDIYLINDLKKIENKTIILATDNDDAGNFIAFEIIDILKKNNNILRLQTAFEELFNFKDIITKNKILNISKDKINYDSALRYWTNEKNNNIQIECINYLLNDKYNEIIEGIQSITPVYRDKGLG